MNPKVLLVGLPGAGASTVGGLLAQRLGWPFLDDTSLVERTSGRSSEVILQSEGPEALHSVESRVLTLLLGMPGPLIGAVPDSLIADERERQRLAGAGAHVVWLRCSLPVLARRVGGRLGLDPATALRRLVAERDGGYAEVASQVVDTDANPAGAVANLIIEALETLETG